MSMPLPPAAAAAAPIEGRLSRLRAVASAAGALCSALVRRTLGGFGRPGGMAMAGNRNDGPPDLDELWRDLNRKLSGLFGNQQRGGNGNPPPREPEPAESVQNQHKTASPRFRPCFIWREAAPFGFKLPRA